MGKQLITLQGLGPQLEGLKWEFESRLRIGRKPTVQVCFHDASVSPEHAEIFPTSQGWVVRDLESATGTFVNGIRVTKTVRKLQQHDLLQCGNSSLRVIALEHEMPLPPMPRGNPSSLKTTGTFLTIKAVAQRSWEQGLEDLAQQQEQRVQQGKHFLTLLRGGYHLSRITCLDEMLQVILDDTVSVLNAQRGAFILKDPATGQLGLRAVSPSPNGVTAAKPYSKTLTERCFSEGQSVLCSDASADVKLHESQSILSGGMASIICGLVRSPRQRLGILHLDRGPLQKPFTQDDFHFVDAIAASIAVGIESAQVVESQRGLFLRNVTALAQRALELRDPATGSHTQRVTAYTLLLAEELHLSPEESRQLEIGAAFHDIGKLAIADAILRKPGQLTAEEFEQVKTHPAQGVAMVETVAELVAVSPIIRHHHEHWDGSGYPDGLSGETIPRLARIVAVADAFDAMTSAQPYGLAMPAERGFTELREKGGSQLDPEFVQAFLRLRPRVELLLAQGGTPQRPFEGKAHLSAMSALAAAKAPG